MRFIKSEKQPRASQFTIGVGVCPSDFKTITLMIANRNQELTTENFRNQSLKENRRLSRLFKSSETRPEIYGNPGECQVSLFESPAASTLKTPRARGPARRNRRLPEERKESADSDRKTNPQNAQKIGGGPKVYFCHFHRSSLPAFHGKVPFKIRQAALVLNRLANFTAPHTDIVNISPVSAVRNASENKRLANVAGQAQTAKRSSSGEANHRAVENSQVDGAPALKRDIVYKIPSVTVYESGLFLPLDAKIRHLGKPHANPERKGTAVITYDRPLRV